MADWDVMRRIGTAVASLALLLSALTVTGGQRAEALDNGLARTPPMGWNGYNHFGRNVTAAIVEAEARALASSGMKAAGYTYVNLDGGWDLLQRNAQGELQPDPAKFPAGIKPVADYVHSLGLKLGIYTTVGTTNCAGTSAGSWGHYQQDADTFASWGVDFVKVDWCAVPLSEFPGMTQEQVAQQLYGEFGSALRGAGRPMVYSMSTNTPVLQAWNWASSVGNMWRTTGDIGDSYAAMVSNFTQNVQHYQDAGPGGWNDPDMLEAGNGGMTATEEQAQMSLWAEMAAPLIAGNDLTTMSPATQQLLSNRDVIAVDQDPLGQQAYPVASTDGHWVLTKPLANGNRAVVLFNQTGQPAVITTTAATVGLPSAPGYLLDDLWQHATTETRGTISAVVPPHGAVMYRVSRTLQPASAPPSTLSSLATADTWLSSGQASTITQTFTDNGSRPVHDITLSLTTPGGWTTTPSRPVTIPAVEPGQSVQQAWTVSAPAPGHPIETATTRGTATYSWGSPAQTSLASSALDLHVVNPVSPPFRTFASTQAHLGQLGTDFSTVADGTDMWVGVDEYATAYLPSAETSNATTTVEVTSQQVTSDWAKAGIIVRNDLTQPGASPGYLILAVTPGHGVVIQRDANGDGYLDSGTPTGGGPSVQLPVWLKLVRSATSYTGYYSTDGSTWTAVGTVTIPAAAATQDVGMFATSHSSGNLGETDFTGFTQTGGSG